MAFFFEANKCEHSIARWLRAGPRKNLFFRPEDVRVAIVTCGGVCPGTNVVVQEITKSLYNNYGVKQIYGIRYGYKGFYSHQWMELNPDVVESIHHCGGMFLGTSRGGFSLEHIIEELVKRQINQVKYTKKFLYVCKRGWGGYLICKVSLSSRKFKING